MNGAPAFSREFDTRLTVITSDVISLDVITLDVISLDVTRRDATQGFNKFSTNVFCIRASQDSIKIPRNSRS